MTAEERHYDHRYHAGNVGDVWKHVALVALLQSRELDGRRLIVVDTHAGAGEYALGPTGEHTEGIGRLAESARERVPAAVSRYLQVALQKPRLYPGSPRVIASQLAGPEDRLFAFELEDQVRAVLERAIRDDQRVRVEGGDGPAALERVLSEARGEAIVLIDPPYADRREWQTVPAAMLRAHRAHPEARFVLWYPVKSYARPNAMLAWLEKSGLAATAIELITSPLSSKKNRLNGSGLLFVRPPIGLIEELSAIAAWLGPLLSAGGGFFTVRVVGLAHQSESEI